MDKPPQTPQRKFRSTESNGDMSTLKTLQAEAEERIAALKHAIDDGSAKPLSTASASESKEPLEEEMSRSPDGRKKSSSKKQTTKSSTETETRKKKSSGKLRGGAQIGEMSMEEINRLIEEQVLRVSRSPQYSSLVARS